MNDKKNKTFIENLSRELSPIKSFWSAEKRLGLWLVIHPLWIVILVSAISPCRETIFNNLLQTNFLTEVSLYLVTIFLVAYFCFLSLTPGAISSKKFKFSILPILFLIGLLIYGFINAGQIPTKIVLRNYCEFEILLYSTIPLTHMYLLIKKSILISRKWTLFFAGLASSFIPACIMHFACAYDYKHILIFHLGTSFFFTMTSFFLLSKLLKK